MDERDDGMNIVEGSEGGIDETNNNNSVNGTNDLVVGNDNDGDVVLKRNDEKRKRFFDQFIKQRDYHEALRSLLWEPYDCREDSETWYCEELEESGAGSQVSESHFVFLSESSLSSCSSCSSSLEEILTVEMATEKSASVTENRYRLNMQRGGKSWKRRAKRPKTFKLEEDNKVFFIDGRRHRQGEKVEEEKDENCFDLPKIKRTIHPSRGLMNWEIMVSDLDAHKGEGVSAGSGHRGALKSTSERIGAGAVQYESSCRANEVRSSLQKNNVSGTVGKMLVTVEGTLEPRDSNEGTQLVSPDTSLDLNENPVRVTGPNRFEPGTSTGNVSVVNCYRAVPVSVVSTVPTIKCLNTQENISNVQIVQSGGTIEPKPSKFSPPTTTQPKRVPVRPAGMPVSSSSRTRVKTPREGNRNQSRHSVGGEQQTFTGRGVAKGERERPKSANVCEQSGSTSGSCQNPAPTGSNNASSVLSNHSRSISNPVLGNQAKPSANRCGSHQNAPVRQETTHFGAEATDRSQPLVSSPVHVPVVENQLSPGRESGAEHSQDSSKASPRTFTSTEAQTDDVPLEIHPQSVINREQRRRERRERRHQRRLHQSVLNSGSVWQSNVDVMHRDRRGLPDILNSHMPPPYSAVPVPNMSALPPPALHAPPQMPIPPGPQTVPHLVDSPPGQPPLPHQNGVRFLFPFPGGRRSQGQMFAHEEETPKSCCGVVVTQTVSIRWFIVMISFVGICCVIVGTVLGAMKASGREHLTVSLLMIGVGIVLVTVSVVAWRLTSQDAPSCRSMLGLGGGNDSGNEPNQRFVPRMPPSYGRPHHPYAAMMYPEFQYRPPPPSYQASMQEYRLRLLLLERPNETAAGLQAAMSPPPTYRSQAGSTLGLRAPTFCRSLPQSEYSHPPSYRSRTSSTRPTLDPTGEPLGSVNHSRNSSLLSHVSDQNGTVSQAVVNVISVVGNPVDLHRGDTDLQIDSIKLDVDEEVPIPPLRMLLNKEKKSPSTTTTTTTTNTTTATTNPINNSNTTRNCEETKSDNINLVTIVTVSDNNVAPTRDHSVESDVLAHL